VFIRKGKELRVNYKLAQQNESTDYYRLNEDSTKWTLVKKLYETRFPKAQNKIEPLTFKEGDSLARIKEGNQADSNGIFVVQYKEGYNVEVRLGKRGMWNVTKIEGARDNGAGDYSKVRNPTSSSGRLYPEVVKGLKVNSFGVYNCDQIYRIKNKITLRGIYVDEKGQKITDGEMLSLIDLDFNAAFSFDPKWFLCDSKANNVLLLSTKSKKLYMLGKGKFQKSSIQGDTLAQFVMKDVTESIKTSNELASYLGL